MHPILFEVGGFQIHAYGALGALAFVVGASLVLWRSRRLGLDLNRVADVIFWMSIGGMTGARLLFVAQNPGSVSSLGQLVDLRGGGLVFYGSFLVGIPVGVFLMRRFALPERKIWDLFGTAFPLSHALSRVGCYAAGCCFGSPTDVSWAVRFPAENPLVPSGVALHPVQLYEALALALIAVITNVFYARRRFDGQVFLLYLGLYAVARAVLEAFRGDIERGFFLEDLLGPTVTFSQGVSVLLGVAAFAAFGWGARKAS